jgi:hypothetical protein
MHINSPGQYAVAWSDNLARRDEQVANQVTGRLYMECCHLKCQRWIMIYDLE